jgi:uncharacterized protein (TIGR03067 family)
MKLAATAIAVVGVFLFADPPEGEDAEKLQGTWTMASFEVNGDPVPEEQLKTGKLVVKGDQYTPMLGDNSLTYTFKLDPTKNPKTIDFKPQDGGTLKGIYELDGDTFKTCRPLLPGEDRPTEFSSKADSGLLVVVWKRQKP